MPSVIALLEMTSAPVAGEVLPIDHYEFTKDQLEYTGDMEESRTALSHGGALYVITRDGNNVWLVAVIETPEVSGLKKGDTRALGWYGPTNTTPVTELSKVWRKLGLGTKARLAARLEFPEVLESEAEDALRQLLGDEDAPVLAVANVSETRGARVSGPPLARAVAHLAASHVVPAIEAMLEAWRESRSPALADLIDRATRVTPEYDRPLFTKRIDDSDADKIWNEAFRKNRAAAMPQLLQNLYLSGRDANIAKLTKLPDDPRVAVRLLEQPMYAPNYETEQYWEPIFRTVARIRDERTYPSFKELAFEIKLTKLDRLMSRAPTAASELPAADARAIEAQLDRLEEPSRMERTLVDAIAEHDDDDTRQIYADWLLERGHPRGEYIALTLQEQRGKLSPASARRLAAISDIPYLFGTLDDLAARRVRKRDRGIDRTLTVYWGTSSLAWRAAAFHPLVRVLESIELLNFAKPHRTKGMAAFIRAAPRLRTLKNIEAKEGNALVKALGGTFRHAGNQLERV